MVFLSSKGDIHTTNGTSAFVRVASKPWQVVRQPIKGGQHAVPRHALAWEGGPNRCITLAMAVSRQWLTGHHHSKHGQQTTASGALPNCGGSRPQPWATNMLSIMVVWVIQTEVVAKCEWWVLLQHQPKTGILETFQGV